MLDLSKFIGIPFEDSGRGPNGFDCWGLVMAVHRECGIDLPDFKVCAFNAVAIGAEIKTQTHDASQWIELEKPEFPCVITIKNHPRMINHCGVYVGDGMFLHTMENIGCVRDRVDSPAWRKRLRGFFKYAG